MQRFFKHIFISILFLSLSIGPIFAQAPDNFKWVEHMNGLISSGSYIIDVAIDPNNNNNVYADIAKFGMYKSVNGGTSWSAINTGLPSFTDTQSMNVSRQGRILFDPNNSAVLYLNADGKIFKTINSGSSWTDISAGSESSSYSNLSLKKNNIYCMANHPTDSNILYAATLSSGYTGGIYKSTNAGSSWTQIGGMTSSSVSTALGFTGNDGCPFTIDQNNPQNIYITTHVNVNYKSVDGGTTWTAMGLFPSYPSNIDVYTVTKNPGNNIIFAGTNLGTFKSSDDGATWQVATGLSGKNAIMMKFAKSDPTVGYALMQGELYRSVNSGASWTLRTSTSDSSWTNLDVSKLNSTTLFITTNIGKIKKSTSGGGSIADSSTGLPSDATFDQFTSFQQSKSDPNIVYFSAKTKMFKSFDAGKTWSKLPDLPAGAAFAETIAVDPTNPNILVITDYSPLNVSMSRPMVLYRSQDGGQTWAQVYSKLPNIDASDRFIDLKFSQTDHNRLYSRTLNGGANSFIVSSDNGLTWTPIATTLFDADFGGFQMLQIDTLNKNIVYAFPENDLPYKSLNAGTSWTQMTFTQDLTGVTSYGTAGIGINPADNTLYAGYQYYDNSFNVLRVQYLKSTNGGTSFSSLTTLEALADGVNGPNVFLHIDNVGTNLYWSNGGTIYHSTDAGATWTSFSQAGIPAGMTSAQYFGAPSTANNGDLLTRLYAFATNTYYFYRYENDIPIFATSVLSSSNLNGTSVYHPGDNIALDYMIKNSGSVMGTNPKAAITIPFANFSITPNTVMTVDGEPVTGFTVSGNTLTIDLPNLDYANQYVLKIFLTANVISNNSLQPQVLSAEDVAGTSTSALNINIVGVPVLVNTGISVVMPIIFGASLVLANILLIYFRRREMLRP